MLDLRERGRAIMESTEEKGASRVLKFWKWNKGFSQNPFNESNILNGLSVRQTSGMDLKSHGMKKNKKAQTKDGI